MRVVVRPLRRLIARGYRPAPPPEVSVTCLIGPSGGGTPQVAVPAGRVADHLGAGHADGIGVLLPTYVARAPLDSHRESVSDLLDQLREVRAAYPRRALVLFVGMQWDPGEERIALDRLAELRTGVGAKPGIAFVGVAMPRIGKAAMLNAVFAVATGLRLAGVAWIDDDVRLRSQCLARVIGAFLARGAQGSVGARKVPEPTRFTAARLLHRGKTVTKTPRFAYPHGCCMIVDAELVRAGIPWRYTCEDDYFCFALLDPDHPDPMHRMHIATDALCHHTVGGRFGEIRRRVRRSLLTAAVLMADFPLPVARIYWAMYFHGLWPLARPETGRGFRFAAVKWLLKAVHFLWFARVAGGLAVRGLIGRPRAEIPWAAYSWQGRPAGATQAGVTPAGPGGPMPT
jgi:hypothetical protein